MSEPTRLPVFLRAWRSGRKACAIAAVAMLALAGSAFGKIGETHEQVIARSKRNVWGDIIGIQADNWQNNPL